MAKLVISKTDIARGMPGPEGWYKAKLVSFERVKAKKDESFNLTPIFEYTSDIDRKIQVWFSEKSLNYNNNFQKFYCAMTHQKLDPKADLDVDTDNIKIGEEVYIRVKKSVNADNGQINNTVDNYVSIKDEIPF